MAEFKCQKCETILRIAGVTGTGPIKCVIGARNSSGYGEVIGHDGLNKPEGVKAEVWYDNTESAVPDGSDIDVDGAHVPPRKIGELTFTSEQDIDGKCPVEPPGRTGDCFAAIEIGGCVSSVRLSWVWEDSAYGARYGMGISGGTWWARDCIDPGVEDEALVTSDASFWTELMTVPAASAAARKGSHLFTETDCGTREDWTISFYDEDAGALRLGIMENRFLITIGCEGCCEKKPH